MLPMREIVSEALRSVYRNPDLVLASLGMMIGLGTIAYMAASLFIGSAIGANAFGMLIALGVIMMVALGLTGFTFNLWVRLGAFGRDRVVDLPKGRLAQLALITGVKIFLIILLLAVVQYLTETVLTLFGYESSEVEVPETEDGEIGFMALDWAGMHTANITQSIIALIITCFGYSFFSANLTATSLNLPSSASLTHANVQDFAVVLIMIYAVSYILQTLAAFTGSNTVYWVVAIITGFWSTFAIAYAHGARYRIAGNLGSSDGEQPSNTV